MIEETKAADNIVVLKLASGEDVIADCVADDTNYYLENPVQIISYPDETTNQMKLGLLPFMPFCKRNGVCLSRIGTHLAIPDEGLVRSYKEFVTGIALPDNKIQLA